MSKWIQFSKRLPIKNKKIIVKTTYGIIQGVYLKKYIEADRYLVFTSNEKRALPFYYYWRYLDENELMAYL